jgi:pimeloyl-ACP methyl ester carboxylesterase
MTALRREGVVRRMSYAALGVILLTTAGLIYQSIATALDKRKYPPPGQLIDIGGYRLHLNCAGNKLSSGPPIIMEAGAMGNSLTWHGIQADLARDSYVCVYDRAGLGWSDPGPAPRTGRQIASELHLLLNKAGVKAPFVLVGHSLGGLYVRLYASQYPEDCTGVVLVDSVHEEQYQDVGEIRRRKIGLRLASIGAQFGLLRLIGISGLSSGFEKFLQSAPPEVLPISRTFYYRTQTWTTGLAEAGAADENRKQARDAGTLGDKPLAVISAGQSDDDEDTRRLWAERQSKLATLSRSHSHVTDKWSGHFIQLDNPELVTQTIRSFVQAASRNNRP